MEISVKGATKAEPKVAAPQGPMSLKLLRHWTPGPHENVTVLGWRKPAVLVRLATGGTVISEPETFVNGEMAPAPVPGANNHSWSVEKGKHEDYIKIWKGTYVEVEADKAYQLIDQGAAQVVRPG